MRTDTEIRHDGFSILFSQMEVVEAERFIALLQREKFDYTQWRQQLFKGLTIEEISARAMAFVRSNESSSGE